MRLGNRAGFELTAWGVALGGVPWRGTSARSRSFKMEARPSDMLKVLVPVLED